jgi:endonuclease/exonuclease/phosphatase family metal-dependent hydrolase
VSGPSAPSPLAGLAAVDPLGQPAGTLEHREVPPGAAPWMAATGPPVWHPRPRDPGTPAALEELRFFTWNVRVGAGDLRGLMEELQAAGGDFVLLLQEVVRMGAPVPAHPTPGSRWAGRISDPLPPGRTREDIGQLALEAGLALLYAPSMRSGGPGDPPEDRGNAILSSLPMTDPSVLELPVERQRRAAVAASVQVRIQEETVPLRLVSVHLENRAPWSRFWRIPGAAREAQAADLLRRLGSPGPLPTPLVLGGDLNSWWGEQSEGAVRRLRRELPEPVTLENLPTHHWELGLDRQSDYLLFRLPEGCTAGVRRLDEERSSDHWPLEGRVSTPGAG